MPLGSIATRAKQRARTLPERHGGPAILVAVALVVALGFGLRLEAALNPNLDPGDATIVAYQGNDSKSYGDIAESLVRDRSLRNAGDEQPDRLVAGRADLLCRRLLPDGRRAPGPCARGRRTSWAR